MTDAVISGRVVRIGDDVDTDVMLPGAYLNITDPEELGTTSWRPTATPRSGSGSPPATSSSPGATAAWARRASTRRWP